MADTPPVEPFEVAMMVETFVNNEHSDALRYDNRAVLDSSGVYDLHSLAARVYAIGVQAGRQVASVYDNGVRQRERDAARLASSDAPNSGEGE